MTRRATADSWKISPLPEQRARLPYQRTLSRAAYRNLSYGLIPRDMDDRWFAYWADDVLFIHRSWTGYAIYEVHFEAADDAYEVSEAWANRDPEQYRGSEELDLDFLDGFIDYLAAQALPDDDSQ